MLLITRWILSYHWSTPNTIDLITSVFNANYPLTTRSWQVQVGQMRVFGDSAHLPLLSILCTCSQLPHSFLTYCLVQTQDTEKYCTNTIHRCIICNKCTDIRYFRNNGFIFRPEKKTPSLFKFIEIRTKCCDYIDWWRVYALHKLKNAHFEM